MPVFHRLGAAFSAFIFLVGIAACGGGGGTGGAGGGTGGGGITSGGVSSPATSLYIAQTTATVSPSSATSDILQFPRSGTGTVTPTATIIGSSGVQLDALAIDQGGRLYAMGGTYSAACGSAAYSGVEIIVYAPGATGKATPARTIAGSATGLPSSCTAYLYDAIDVDNAGNIYVPEGVAVGSGPGGLVYPGILVFAPTANGNVAPLKSIAGPSTTIEAPNYQIAVDSAGTIYVANFSPNGPGYVTIFNSSATGDAAPTGTLSGSNTMIYNIQGIAVDHSGDIYVASLAQAQAPNPPLSGTPSILEFSAGSTGNVAPIRIISGSATTMGEIGNLRVDSEGNIYVFGDVSRTILLKFSSTATGNVAPSASISLSAYSNVGGIAVQ